MSVNAALLVVAGLGLAMYVLVSVTTRSATSSGAIAPRRRRPGWIARRRARAGIHHRRDRVGVGYTSATRTVHLTPRELAGHGFVSGGPGSGKTNFLQLLVEAAAGRMPTVIVDPKGSPALEATVRAHGGQVWTLDGRLPADLLDPRPWQVPDLLLEAEDYSADGRVYRDAAHQRALWAAWALALRREPMDLARLRRLLDREALLEALEPFRGRDQRIGEWIDRLERQHGGVEDSGARGLDRSLGILLDGPAMRGSLRTCPEALRLEDVLETNGLVLFKLDAADYPHATRKVAAWVLLAMGRLAKQLPDLLATNKSPRALLLVDEVGALGSSARHLRGLVGRAREAGLAVVLATQGPSDLEAVDRALLDQVLQDTAWQLAFRQGSPHDARLLEALFGEHQVDDVTRYSDGRTSMHQVREARVQADEWMNGLEVGDAWLRVAPVDGRWRQERVRVAMPTRSTVEQLRPEPGSRTMARTYSESAGSAGSDEVYEGDEGAAAAPREDETTERLALRPPDCPAELVEKMGADIVSRTRRLWPRQHRELGPCMVWTGPTKSNEGRYGWMWDKAIGRMDVSDRVVWRRVNGPIPKDPKTGKTLEVDHLCEITLCQRPDHLRLLSKGDNVRRRGPTRRRRDQAP